MADRYDSLYTGQQIDDAVAKRHLTGVADPTTATAGVLGQRYFNTATGATFECTGVSGGVYTWTNKIGEINSQLAIKLDKTASPNRNLLHNGNFSINQRNASGTINTTGYFVDRWRLAFGAVAVGADGISHTAGSEASIEQYIENGVTAGRTYTISALLSDGTIVSGNGTAPSTAQNVDFVINAKIVLGLKLSATGLYGVYTYWNTSMASTIKAVKLELGSTSTFANDPPADYGEQLALCQRYFRRLSANSLASYARFGFGSVYTATRAGVIINYPVEMRVRPTITNYGPLMLLSNNNQVAVTALAPDQVTTQNCSLNADVASGLTTGQCVQLCASASATAHIDFSADL